MYNPKLKRVGFGVGADLLKQTADLEQEIIKNGILSVISEKIKPVTTQIERELVVEVDCVPNEPLNVHTSRKRNFTEQMETIEICLTNKWNIMIDKVRELGIVQCGVPLISNTLDDAYSNSQKDVAF